MTTALRPAALPGELLVSRLHVDLLRVSTAACPAR
ncbi:putative leader peptide [Modestobacter sp. SYSU DS0290]